MAHSVDPEGFIEVCECPATPAGMSDEEWAVILERKQFAVAKYAKSDVREHTELLAYTQTCLDAVLARMKRRSRG